MLQACTPLCWKWSQVPFSRVAEDHRKNRLKLKLPWHFGKGAAHLLDMGVSYSKMGVPQVRWMVDFMEHPQTKMDDYWGQPFSKKKHFFVLLNSPKSHTLIPEAQTSPQFRWDPWPKNRCRRRISVKIHGFLNFCCSQPQRFRSKKLTFGGS